MPRFHFHIVEDGRVVTDEEGQELTERDAVREESSGNRPFNCQGCVHPRERDVRPLE